MGVIIVNPYSVEIFNNYSTQFDGVNEDIIKSYEAALHPAATSYSVWIKSTATISAIMSQFRWLGGTNYQGVALYIGGTNKFAVNAANSSNSLTQLVGTSNINTGNWLHLCATLTQTNIKIYVNGILEGATSGANLYSMSGSPTATALTIGRDSASNLPYYYSGKIAAPAIFNKELTLAEVNEVMNRKMGDLRMTSVGANLIWAGYYPNGTSNYPTMIDYAGSSFNGTLTNMESGDINTDIPV